MSVARDPAIYGTSGYPRNPRDLYRTEGWVTRALLRGYPELLEGCPEVWEPAAGLGDMARVLIDAGLMVNSSDVYVHDDLAALYEEGGDGHPFALAQHDFLDPHVPWPDWTDEPWEKAIVTNPPYSLAVPFVRRALELVRGGDFRVIAMLLRLEFASAVTRRNLFADCPEFACELRLLHRPRWDEWWEGKEAGKGPRHVFAWFVWDARSVGREPVVRWAGREEGDG